MFPCRKSFSHYLENLLHYPHFKIRWLFPYHQLQTYIYPLSYCYTFWIPCILFYKNGINHIITDCQQRFRPRKSAVTSSLVFSTYILDSLEITSHIDAIFTDFLKDLDTVDYGTLICIPTILISVIHFFPDCHPTLTLGNNLFLLVELFSDLHIILWGILQGSHLSSLLFLIYVNSLNDFLSYAKVLLFANDIKLFLKVTSPSDCLLR